MKKYKPTVEKTIENVKYLHELTGRSMPDCLKAIETTDSNLTVDVIINLLKRGIPLIGFASKAEERKFLQMRPDWTGICNRLDLETPDNKEITTLPVRCPHCGETTIIYMRTKDWEEFKSGSGSIQEIFPYLSNGLREMLLSGMCEKCFDRIFAEED